ncbi:MAG: hypothetical protein CMH04_13040 [Marinovum sp.]|nr:hypothetical protein [Marinovum sp.]
MKPETELSTEFTRIKHDENEREFRRISNKVFRKLLDKSAKQGYPYDPIFYQEQVRFLQQTFYRSNGNGPGTTIMMMHTDDRMDEKTNSSAVKQTLVNKYGDKAHPLVHENAANYLRAVHGIRYLPATTDDFVTINHSSFRNIYKPTLLKFNTRSHIERPPQWQEYLDRLMPQEHECTLVDGEKVKQQDYFDKWVAQRIQTPHEANNVAILLRGKNGTGKNNWCDNMMPKLLGVSNYTAASAKDMTGEFNGWLYLNTLVHVEEMHDNRSKTSDTFKKIITQERALVNEKMIPKFMADKYFGLVISSNAHDPIKIEATDRRYFIPCFSDHLHSKEDTHEFFSGFVEWLNEDDGLQQMFNYFHSVDLSKVSFRYPPNTPEKEFLAEEEHSSEQRTIVAAQILASDTGYAWQTVQVQDKFKLTQPNARIALMNAGFVKHRIRFGSKNAINAWVHKSFIPSANEKWPPLYTEYNNKTVCIQEREAEEPSECEATFIRVEEELT